MSEMRAICREAVRLRAKRVPFLLATVVRVSGSAYRRPGARMLMAQGRWIAGSVSGGCLERDVLLRGEFRTRSGKPALVTYDSTSDEDVRWGMGLGCNGVVDVLVERIDEATEMDPARFAGECLDEEATGALATVFASDSVPVGARVAVRGGAVVASTVSDPALADVLAREALVAVTDEARIARVVRVGRVEALVETFRPPPHLFVIGTRHDAVPLVALARGMDLPVTIADTWGDEATRARFAGADRLLFGSPSEIARAVDRHARAAVVVMSHDYDKDRDCLAALLATRARYVGVLGPRARTARMLVDSRVTLSDELCARLHAPVGLDLGAETPAEIALAVLAEVQATFAGTSGLRLREGAGPIHGAPIARAEAVLG
jgi:xanthine/CO dehydrogenase XdhC/CoxF family maturation factor